MDEKILNEALENVSVIKGVIDRTSKSFAAFSKIFIYWGLLFIVNGVINLAVVANWHILIDFVSSYRVLSFIIHPGIITIIAALIYFRISGKIPLAGLEKHLMTIWVLILIMNAIQPKITVKTVLTSVDFEKIIVSTDNFPVILFGLAIGLIATGLFAGFKHLRNLGIIYICISLIYALSGLQLFDGPTLFQVIYSLPLPFTFMYTGLFLRTKHLGGN